MTTARQEAALSVIRCKTVDKQQLSAGYINIIQLLRNC